MKRLTAAVLVVSLAAEPLAAIPAFARRYGVPVATCNTAYMNEREMPYWKITAVRETFLHDTSLAPTPEHVLGVLSVLPCDSRSSLPWPRMCSAAR